MICTWKLGWKHAWAHSSSKEKHRVTCSSSRPEEACRGVHLTLEETRSPTRSVSINVHGGTQCALGGIPCLSPLSALLFVCHAHSNNLLARKIIISSYHGVILIENNYSSGSESLIGISISIIKLERWSETTFSTAVYLEFQDQTLEIVVSIESVMVLHLSQIRDI